MGVFVKIITALCFSFSFLNSVAKAADHLVSPSESIQDAVDNANAGDTIIIQPGTYQGAANATYGVRINKDGISLIKDESVDGDVVIEYLPESEQRVGVHFAPVGCDWDTPGGDDGCIPGEPITGISIKGITVKGFPGNGIQTRCVDDFEILNCESDGNLNNGLYPTLSTNGMVKNSTTHGSLDAGLWPSGCENVTMLSNHIYDNVIGLEVTVSNRVWAKENDIHDNSVGVGLFHPNESGNPARPVMAGWGIEDNTIYNNNRVNDSPPESLQSKAPAGLGVLMMGVSDHTVVNNKIFGNGSGGLALLGYCTALEIAEDGCEGVELKAGPSANNNLISQNAFYDNGNDRVSLLVEAGIPGADILYFQSPSLDENGDGNCFDSSIPTSHFAVIDGEPSFLLGQTLPDGCDFRPFAFTTWLLNTLYALPGLIFQLIFT